MTYYDDDNEQHILAGHTFLDEHVPNWEKNYNADELDMSQSHSCLIAQSYESSFISIVTSHPDFKYLETSDWVAMGFSIDHALGETYTDCLPRYNALTERQRKLIHIRLIQKGLVNDTTISKQD